MRRFLIPLILLLLCAASHGENRGQVSGRVLDSSGAVIRGAQIVLRCGSESRKTQSSVRGDFEFRDFSRGNCTVTASAPGFAPQTLAADSVTNFALAPLGSDEAITVTAARSTLATSDLPVTGVDKTRAQLQIEPALTIDQKLRQIPGFALYRRSGSDTANPTTQGVSLRGLGASGASRSLVLADGVPINDPFGGWIYWGQVPLESIDHIDVVEGGVSDLYGSDALGGVINIRTDHRLRTAFSGESSFGSMATPMGSFMGSVSRGQWGAIFSGESFNTNGYIPVAKDFRGPVDTYANSDHRSGDLMIQRQSTNTRVFLRGSLYGESRRNGTYLQVNQATLRRLQTGADWNNAHLGTLNVRVFGGTENLHQTFSAVNDTRTSESLVVNQHVPVSEYGGSAQWSKLLGHHMLAIGVDDLNVTGDTNEQHYFRDKYSYLLIAGGTQRTTGVFAEDLWQVTPHWLLSGSLRLDLWTNTNASSRTFHASGATQTTPFPNRSETALSPRFGVTRVITSRVSLYGSAYRSFRAPTLNELYRSFRVGNVVTNANEDLKAEHFTGGEFGARIRATDHLDLRATFYGGVLDNNVENVTIASTPTLITRQRQNIGTIRLRGLELAGQARITSNLSLQAAYQFTDSTIRTNPSDPSLVGKAVPLVPRHAVTFAATYDNPRLLTFSIQGRSNSTEYDNDQNTLPLDPYFNLGVYVTHRLKPGLQLFAASQNLLNSTYTIARTPVPSIAEPRSIRVGLRFEIGELRAK